MKTIFLKYICLVAWLTACGSADKGEHKAENTNQTTLNPAMVHLNQAQIKAIGLQLGTWEQVRMGLSIKANGVVDVPPNGRAVITAPMEGFVRKSEILVGDYVQAGQVMTILEHPNFITLQEHFLTVKNELIYLEQDLQRQKELSTENVNAKKNLQRVQADYEIKRAQKSAGEAQLRLLGIEPNYLTTSNLSGQIFLKSPISGYVKTANAMLGKNVAPNEILYEIVNESHKHLELKVFEKDILKVSKGQKVVFSSPNLSQETYEGSVYLIGKAMENDTKAVNVHVHFADKTAESKFLEGMYVNARILLDNQTVNALPETALIREGEQNFIFIQKNNTDFVRVGVRILATQDQFVALEVLEELPKTVKIVKKGAYYLQAEMNKGEAENGH
ncbi:MAG: efflux RND transporter periplasmic adaptor subunit [Microscillaceae bacterium]|jgi:cobalt-zinc-cadmium efflux system membrane fusion protein|nr:efflux RND transporter periplasmic adaptor subunit [Microscillaceae bacterium]